MRIENLKFSIVCLRRVCASICVAVLSLSGWFTATAAEIAVPETQAKAAFLFGFPKYIEWPAHAFSSATNPISICVAGEAEIAQALEKIAEGKLIGGRPVIVKRLMSPHDCSGCHLLFVGGAQRFQAFEYLRRTQDKPTVTVADFDSFLDSGGMINLEMKGNRIRFQVSLKPAERADLRFSSKLLSLAEVVRGKSTP